MTTSEVVVAANARTNRWMRKLAVVVALLLLALVSTGLVVEVVSLRHADHQRNLLVDQGRLLAECTIAGPKPPPDTGHPCFDRGAQGTVAAIAQLRRSIDCAALYAVGQRDPACTDVSARMDAIAAGENPFAPSPPDTSKGTP